MTKILQHRSYEILEAAIYAKDLKAAKAFYQDILCFELFQEVKDRHLFFRAGNSVLLIFNPDATMMANNNTTFPVPTHGASGQGHVCFATDNSELETLKALFAKHRIDIDADFRWPNGARSIYVRDPAGNSIEFAEPKLWQTPDP